jgi:hypothetical protein
MSHLFRQAALLHLRCLEYFAFCMSKQFPTNNWPTHGPSALKLHRCIGLGQLWTLMILRLLGQRSRSHWPCMLKWFLTNNLTTNRTNIIILYMYIHVLSSTICDNFVIQLSHTTFKVTMTLWLVMTSRYIVTPN